MSTNDSDFNAPPNETPEEREARLEFEAILEAERQFMEEQAAEEAMYGNKNKKEKFNFEFNSEDHLYLVDQKKLHTAPKPQQDSIYGQDNDEIEHLLKENTTSQHNVTETTPTPTTLPKADWYNHFQTKFEEYAAKHDPKRQQTVLLDEDLNMANGFIHCHQFPFGHQNYAIPPFLFVPTSDPWIKSCNEALILFIQALRLINGFLIDFDGQQVILSQGQFDYYNTTVCPKLVILPARAISIPISQNIFVQPLGMSQIQKKSAPNYLDHAARFAFQYQEYDLLHELQESCRILLPIDILFDLAPITNQWVRGHNTLHPFNDWKIEWHPQQQKLINDLLLSPILHSSPRNVQIHINQLLSIPKCVDNEYLNIIIPPGLVNKDNYAISKKSLFALQYLPAIISNIFSRLIVNPKHPHYPVHKELIYIIIGWLKNYPKHIHPTDFCNTQFVPNPFNLPTLTRWNNSTLYSSEFHYFLANVGSDWDDKDNIDLDKVGVVEWCSLQPPPSSLSTRGPFGTKPPIFTDTTTTTTKSAHNTIYGDDIDQPIDNSKRASAPPPSSSSSSQPGIIYLWSYPPHPGSIGLHSVGKLNDIGQELSQKLDEIWSIPEPTSRINHTTISTKPFDHKMIKLDNTLPGLINSDPTALTTTQTPNKPTPVNFSIANYILQHQLLPYFQPSIFYAIYASYTFFQRCARDLQSVIMLITWKDFYSSITRPVRWIDVVVKYLSWMKPRILLELLAAITNPAFIPQQRLQEGPIYPPFRRPLGDSLDYDQRLADLEIIRFMEFLPPITAENPTIPVRLISPSRRPNHIKFKPFNPDPDLQYIRDLYDPIILGLDQDEMNPQSSESEMKLSVRPFISAHPNLSDATQYQLQPHYQQQQKGGSSNFDPRTHRYIGSIIVTALVMEDIAPAPPKDLCASRQKYKTWQLYTSTSGAHDPNVLTESHLESAFLPRFLGGTQSSVYNASPPYVYTAVQGMNLDREHLVTEIQFPNVILDLILPALNSQRLSTHLNQITTQRPDITVYYSPSGFPTYQINQHQVKPSVLQVILDDSTTSNYSTQTDRANGLMYMAHHLFQYLESIHKLHQSLHIDKKSPLTPYIFNSRGVGQFETIKNPFDRPFSVLNPYVGNAYETIPMSLHHENSSIFEIRSNYEIHHYIRRTLLTTTLSTVFGNRSSHKLQHTIPDRFLNHGMADGDFGSFIRLLAWSLADPVSHVGMVTAQHGKKAYRDNNSIKSSLKWEQPDQDDDHDDNQTQSSMYSSSHMYPMYPTSHLPSHRYPTNQPVPQALTRKPTPGWIKNNPLIQRTKRKNYGLMKRFKNEDMKFYSPDAFTRFSYDSHMHSLVHRRLAKMYSTSLQFTHIGRPLEKYSPLIKRLIGSLNTDPYRPIYTTFDPKTNLVNLNHPPPISQLASLTKAAYEASIIPVDFISQYKRASVKNILYFFYTTLFLSYPTMLVDPDLTTAQDNSSILDPPGQEPAVPLYTQKLSATNNYSTLLTSLTVYNQGDKLDYLVFDSLSWLKHYCATILTQEAFSNLFDTTSTQSLVNNPIYSTSYYPYSRPHDASDPIITDPALNKYKHGWIDGILTTPNYWQLLRESHKGLVNLPPGPKTPQVDGYSLDLSVDDDKRIQNQPWDSTTTTTTGSESQDTTSGPVLSYLRDWELVSPIADTTGGHPLDPRDTYNSLRKDTLPPSFLQSTTDRFHPTELSLVSTSYNYHISTRHYLQPDWCLGNDPNGGTDLNPFSPLQPLSEYALVTAENQKIKPTLSAEITKVESDDVISTVSIPQPTLVSEKIEEYFNYLDRTTLLNHSVLVPTSQIEFGVIPTRHVGSFYYSIPPTKSIISMVLSNTHLPSIFDTFQPLHISPHIMTYWNIANALGFSSSYLSTAMTLRPGSFQYKLDDLHKAQIELMNLDTVIPESISYLRHLSPTDCNFPSNISSHTFPNQTHHTILVPFYFAFTRHYPTFASLTPTWVSATNRPHPLGNNSLLSYPYTRLDVSQTDNKYGAHVHFASAQEHHIIDGFSSFSLSQTHIDSLLYPSFATFNLQTFSNNISLSITNHSNFVRAAVGTIRALSRRATQKQLIEIYFELFENYRKTPLPDQITPGHFIASINHYRSFFSQLLSQGIVPLTPTTFSRLVVYCADHLVLQHEFLTMAGWDKLTSQNSSDEELIGHESNELNSVVKPTTNQIEEFNPYSLVQSPTTPAQITSNIIKGYKFLLPPISPNNFAQSLVEAFFKIAQSTLIKLSQFYERYMGREMVSISTTGSIHVGPDIFLRNDNQRFINIDPTKEGSEENSSSIIASHLGAKHGLSRLQDSIAPTSSSPSSSSFSQQIFAGDFQSHTVTTYELSITWLCFGHIFIVELYKEALKPNLSQNDQTNKINTSSTEPEPSSSIIESFYNNNRHLYTSFPSLSPDIIPYASGSTSLIDEFPLQDSEEGLILLSNLRTEKWALLFSLVVGRDYHIFRTNIGFSIATAISSSLEQFLHWSNSSFTAAGTLLRSLKDGLRYQRLETRRVETALAVIVQGNEQFLDQIEFPCISTSMAMIDSTIIPFDQTIIGDYYNLFLIGGQDDDGIGLNKSKRQLHENIPMGLLYWYIDCVSGVSTDDFMTLMMGIDLKTSSTASSVGFVSTPTWETKGDENKNKRPEAQQLVAEDDCQNDDNQHQYDVITTDLYSFSANSTNQSILLYPLSYDTFNAPFYWETIQLNNNHKQNEKHQSTQLLAVYTGAAVLSTPGTQTSSDAPNNYTQFLEQQLNDPRYKANGKY